MSVLIQEFVKDAYSMPDIDWFIDRWVPKFIKLEGRLADCASREQSLILQLGERDKRLAEVEKLVKKWRIPTEYGVVPIFLEDCADELEAALHENGDNK